MSISVVINHTPWRPERVAALAAMKKALSLRGDEPWLFLNDKDYRGRDWQQAKVEWAIDQWRWASRMPTTHHLFMTDDLHLAPRFWDILGAMLHVANDRPVGLLSNHPEALGCSIMGPRWYRTNSWLVGPAYVLPHAFLVDFLEWFLAKPDGTQLGGKGYANDDSSINEFVTQIGSYSLHPVPTIIEHRHDVESTVGHGDKFSRERVSWRAARQTLEHQNGFKWIDTPMPFDLDAMAQVEFWKGAHDAPMLRVGE